MESYSKTFRLQSQKGKLSFWIKLMHGSDTSAGQTAKHCGIFYKPHNLNFCNEHKALCIHVKACRMFARHDKNEWHRLSNSCGVM